MGGQNMAGLWSAGYFVLFWFFGFVLVQGIPLPVIGAFIAAIGATPPLSCVFCYYRG